MSPESRPPQPPQDEGNWLQRQWQRLRGRTPSTDTILAQIGEDARHVVVGKNIIQIGSLTIPLWLVMFIGVVVVAGVGIGIVRSAQQSGQLETIAQAVTAPTSTPTPTPTATPQPTPTPVRMDDSFFSVAVAEFAQVGNDGDLQPSSVGSTLSRLLYSGMQETQLDSVSFVAADDIQVWYLADNHAARHLTQGWIPGRTIEERGAYAEDLARQIGAQMIINGYFTVAGDEASLVLEFFYHPDHYILRDQPDAVGGRHELGLPITFRAAPDTPITTIQARVIDRLRFRAEILAWLALGLAFDAHDSPEAALQVFQAAEAGLKDWHRDDGKELLYYLLGRSALYLRRYDEAQEAFQMALNLNDTYANALMGMGSIHFDRAQLFFLRGRSIPEGVDACVDAAAVEGGAETLPEAMQEIEAALVFFDRALAAAPTAPWPPIAAIANLNLGLGHWLHGQALAFQEQPDAAGAAYTQATESLTSALPDFSRRSEVELRGHTYLGLGITHLAWGNLHARQQDEPSSLQHFGAAFGYLNQCIELGDIPGATHFFIRQIVECGCTPYRIEAERALLERGGGDG